MKIVTVMHTHTYIHTHMHTHMHTLTHAHTITHRQTLTSYICSSYLAINVDSWVQIILTS